MTEVSRTGVEGLDDILRGGLPSNCLYLIQGDPGVGKTTFALQYLLEGAKRGEAGMYITLSETKRELLKVAGSHGWSLDSIDIFELSAVEHLLAAESQNTVFHPTEIELSQTVEILLKEVEKAKPMRVVFDSLSEIRLLAQGPLRYRRQILLLKQFFAGRNCTVLLLDDNTSERGDLRVESIAHGVVTINRSVAEYGTPRRWIDVTKLRGVPYREGQHDFCIRTGGIEVFPRLVASEHHTVFKRQSISSGIPEFDALLGGGLDRGTSALFIGPAGVGKSTLAMQFIADAAKRGERSVLFAFDETIGTSMARATALGIDLQPHIDSGLITARQIDPAEISPGELTHRLRRLVENEHVRLAVIDSLNGYMHAMPGERFLTLQLHELLSYLAQQGVTTIMTMAQQGLIGQMQSPIDLTYLGDTLVLFRFFENRGQVKKAISIIKKRSGNHENTIREFSTAGGKLTVGQPLTQFHGILTGVPIFKDDGELSSKVPHAL